MKSFHSSQTALILEYLKQHHSLTPLEALDLFGCLRLGARIAELRAQGYEIETEMVTVKRNGTVKRFACYRLVA